MPPSSLEEGNDSAYALSAKVWRVIRATPTRTPAAEALNARRRSARWLAEPRPTAPTITASRDRGARTRHRDLGAV